MVSPQVPVPAFTGLVAHHDDRFGFSLFAPDGWVRLEVTDGEGVFYAPSADDSLTGLAVAARDLPSVVRASDLPALRRGFLAGVRRLPDSLIESRAAEVVGRLITLEARHTYRDGAALRKRWVRLLYQDRVQLRLIAQAASIEQFAHWEPMFYTAMRTVRFGDPWSW